MIVEELCTGWILVAMSALTALVWSDILYKYISEIVTSGPCCSVVYFLYIAKFVFLFDYVYVSKYFQVAPSSDTLADQSRSPVNSSGGIDRHINKRKYKSKVCFALLCLQTGNP